MTHFDKQFREDYGYHNSNYEATSKRVKKSKMYEDLSTVCIIPTPTGMVHAKFVQYFSGMMRPMNQLFHVHFESGKEVGQAYSDAIEMILSNDFLKKFQYLLFVEWDNIIFQPDAAMMLYEDMEKYDVAAGLYFTKGEGGAPMSYGQITDSLNFRPFMPPENSVTQVYGVGQGFTLCKMKIFKDQRLDKPFFRTVQEFKQGVGARQYTQDLEWCERIGKLGYRICVDSRVRIGHMDLNDGTIW